MTEKRVEKIEIQLQEQSVEIGNLKLSQKGIEGELKLMGKDIAGISKTLTDILSRIDVYMGKQVDIDQKVHDNTETIKLLRRKMEETCKNSETIEKKVNTIDRKFSYVAGVVAALFVVWEILRYFEIFK